MQYAGQTAAELHAQGFRQTSRAHGMVARSPQSDAELLHFFVERRVAAVADPERRLRATGLAACTPEQRRDHYRRCYARGEDRIEGIPAHIMSALRALGD